MNTNRIDNYILLAILFLLSNLSFADLKTDEFTFLVENFDYKIPTPKITKLDGQSCQIAKSGELLTPALFNQQYPEIISSLQQTRNFFGHSNGIAIPIKLITDFTISIDPKIKEKITHINGSYAIKLNCKEILIYASSNEGQINGITTLESLIGSNKGDLPSGEIIDYPLTKTRVLHLPLRPTDMLHFKRTIKRARFAHFNTLILMITSGINLNFSEKLDGKKLWSKKNVSDAIQLVKANGLELIPELKLLTHQKHFLGNSRPDLMYNKATYDPRNKNLYLKIVFPAIDELIEITGATKFHIGHDEVVGWKNKHYVKNLLNVGEAQLPPELFLQDILTLYSYLKKKNIEVWMWGDMLITKDEFPEMKGAGANLNGYNGYNKIRKEIPADIVITDWHYRGSQTEFPTSLSFAKNNHKVLGATWDNKETILNFTKYVNRLPFNGEGMIATTWYGYSKKNNQIFNIITISAEAFWNEK